MNKLFKILAFVTFGISGISHARVECRFNSNDPLLIMSPGVQPVITPLPQGTVTSPVQISNAIIMETTPSLRSSCSVGDDTEDVWQLTNSAMLDGEIDGKATFRTNVPGIVYTLAFYPDGKGVTAWFPPNANGQFYLTGDLEHDQEYIVDGKTWHVSMEFWQTNAFQGVPLDQNFLTASSGPIGQILLGRPSGSVSDHPRPMVNMSQMSFSIPLNRPACVLRAPTTVDLGEWSPADVDSGTTSKVAFKITGTCANTKLVQYTLSSAHTTADKTYFTNAVEGEGIAAAGGVGVRILSSPGDHYPVKADSWKLPIAVTDYDGTPPTVLDTTIWAQLVKIGSEPVTVGRFGTTITFNITYE